MNCDSALAGLQEICTRISSCLHGLGVTCTVFFRWVGEVPDRQRKGIPTIRAITSPEVMRPIAGLVRVAAALRHAVQEVAQRFDRLAAPTPVNQRARQAGWGWKPEPPEPNRNENRERSLRGEERGSEFPDSG